MKTKRKKEGNALKGFGLLAVLALTAGCATYETAGPVKDAWPEDPKIAPHQLHSASAAAPGWDHELEEESRPVPVSEVGIFDLGYRFYVKGLTQFDGPRCEHRPTCSVYSYQAVRKHGVVMGTFLGVDRLMRGTRSSALRRLPIYRIDEGMIYYRDPVEANDFFL